MSDQKKQISPEVLAKAVEAARLAAQRIAGITPALRAMQEPQFLSAIQQLQSSILANENALQSATANIAKLASAPIVDARNIVDSYDSSIAHTATKIQQSLTSFSANTAYLQSISQTTNHLKDFQSALTGKNSDFQALIRSLGKKKNEIGLEPLMVANQLRALIEENYEIGKKELENKEIVGRLARETLDMTLPVDAPLAGTIHPVSQVMDELAEIFADLGFAVATGPEIEDDWHNFTALNIPETHPARAMHDTFYLAGEHERPMVLRTHTSPVQIRAMKAAGGNQPIRIIAPGRTYRSDSDATHTPMFHQVEGLVIDKGITLGHLKWTLETFLRAFFERDDVVLRLRPSYFPFTEPSAEVDVGYSVVKGKRVIGGSEGWMEVLGSGMIHRKVLEAGGYDPAEWQGFAFGCGIDRLAMLKYGMDDLRPFFDGDIRWLKHYGFSSLDVPTLSGGVGA